MNIRFFITAALINLLAVTASADFQKEIFELSKEKYQLTRQIGKLFRDKKLSNTPEYQAIQQKAYEASRGYMKAQKAHPKLKELYTKSDAAQKKWINARLAKDKDAEKSARSAFTQSRIDIEKASRDIPDLVELQKKAIAINKESEAKQKELLATTPEGKELIEKINALEAKIAELRKKVLEKQ